MNEREAVINELLKHDIIADPEVVSYIIERGGVKYVRSIVEKYGHLGYITYEDIIPRTEGESTQSVVQVVSVPEVKGVQDEEKSAFSEPIAAEYDWEFEVLLDASVNMKASGSADDFRRLFEDRYIKIRNIITARMSMRNARSIVNLPDGDVATVGMVYDVRRTSTGKLMFELEDPTGRVRCLYSGDEIILNDEVIGVRGRYSKSKGLIFVKEIVRPDIPYSRKRRNIEEDISVAIISDVHVGSTTFLDKRWEKFLKWLRSGKDGAEKIKYLLIAGDLVDGIGVYPKQEEELEILDIFEQYEALARYLEEVPDYIKVVMIPGNHDIVRNAEPQPALPGEIRKLFNGNAEFLSNPTMFSIHGYKFMLYHGGSLNSLVELIPGMDYEMTDKMMEYMLKVRHLAPVYGDKVPLVPLPRDFLVIEDVPDVLVTGHVHTFSYGIYKGVHLINASTWQEQTKYQKMMNFNPDPGKVAILNLHEDRVYIKEF